MGDRDLDEGACIGYLPAPGELLPALCRQLLEDLTLPISAEAVVEGVVQMFEAEIA